MDELELGFEIKELERKLIFLEREQVKHDSLSAEYTSLDAQIVLIVKELNVLIAYREAKKPKPYKPKNEARVQFLMTVFTFVLGVVIGALSLDIQVHTSPNSIEVNLVNK